MQTLLFSALLCGSAAAQLSVTTIGAKEAAKCFQNATDEFATDTSPCDAALDDRTTIRQDEKKTLVNRGVIHNRNGDVQLAINDFDAALKIDGELAEAFLNRGNSYFRARRFDDALSDYSHALELNVSKPWAAWYNIGLVHSVKKDKEKARAAYQKALELNPDFIMAREKLAVL